MPASSSLVQFSSYWIPWAHTIIALSAFTCALIVGVLCHYEKIVQNEFYGYPHEWFPSVSATIGDRYPERSIFQILIAIASGPRFALVALWYLFFKTSNVNPIATYTLTFFGLLRTLSCGGWTYVTSTDNHRWHDVFMILYLVATLPWALFCIMYGPTNQVALRWRKRLATIFFATFIPLIYFFIQHKARRVPGAYTVYAFFEWSLVLLDVAFDAVALLDLGNLEIIVRPLTADSKLPRETQIRTEKNAQLIKEDAISHEKSVKQVVTSHTILGLSGLLLELLSETYIAYMLWTMLTSLGLVIWYFPLWRLGISGYEIFILSTVSPYLLCFREVRKLVLRYLHAIQLITPSFFLAWTIQKPAYRVFVVSFGLAVFCLIWTASLYTVRFDKLRLSLRAYAFALGLLLSSVLKYFNYTNNPMWPILNSSIGGWNKSGLLLGCIAMYCATRYSPVPRSRRYPINPKLIGGNSLCASIGLASIFFALHFLLSDSSTMILWTWEGYPVHGPQAVPYGAVTLIVMGLGLLCGYLMDNVARNFAFYVAASCGAILLTMKRNWLGYAGGLILAAFVMCATPIVIQSALAYPVGRTFGTAFAIYNVLVIMHVWAVAYAFVPAGFLLRERTDWIMVLMMIMLRIGVFNANHLDSWDKHKHIIMKHLLNEEEIREFKEEEIAATPSKDQAEAEAEVEKKSRSNFTRALYIILAGIEMLALVVTVHRFAEVTQVSLPYHGSERLITAGIWTIHFSLDNNMWTSERRIENLLRDLEVDIIGLLESDLQRIITGNRDTTQYLAAKLGMYVDYGPGPNKHTWGAALLSRFPIINSTHHLLPSPAGELAPAIHATIMAYDTLVDIFVVHSGQEEDVEDRRLQANYMAELMARNASRPAILLSYLVTRPHQSNYNTYVGALSGNMLDVDPSDHDRWCQYILYRGLRRTGYARVSRSTITDTELQVAKFQVPLPQTPSSFNTSNSLIPRTLVPPALRFPDKFLPPGERGHFYHIFNEPRYYA